MRKFVVPAALALAVLSAPAFAADLGKMVTKASAPPPSPWDFAFGSSIVSDYVFRGISQSNHKPSVSAYFEPRYNVSKDLQLYVGVAGESISFPNRAAAEVDLYAGFRPTVGSLAFDFGFWYYWYPGGSCFNNTLTGDCLANGALPINGNFIKKDLSFWEVYAKVTHTAGPWALGANFYYTPSFLNSGADGEYVSGTVKWTSPSTLANGVGWYASGEFGRQFLGTSDAFYGTTVASPTGGGPFPAGINYKDYNTWNVGIGFTYKVFTLDLRYSDTDLSKANCNAFTSDYTARFGGNFSPINPGGFGSNWCGATFIAKFAADLTLDNLK